MLIARRERSTHWYLPDGTPFYEVPYADPTRGMRPAKITDAVKAGALRSVTNVMSVMAKPGLLNWRIEQAMIAALTLPRKPDEDLHSYAERALVDSEVQVVDAASSGERIHDLASQFLKEGRLPVDPQEARILKPFMDWVRANVKRTIYSERVVVNPDMYYAGRLDAFVELQLGGYAIIDLKTQEMAKDKAGVPKADFYPEWPIQLAAYARCEQLQFWTPVNHKLISVVLNRKEPGWGLKEWPASATHFAAFEACCVMWSYLKGCTPGFKEAA